jgi:hypothetical protein
MLLELSERGDPVFELPFPIVPEFRHNIRPVAWCMRNELLPVPSFCRKSDHLVVKKNVKIVNNRVNAGTEKCATNVVLRSGITFARGCGRKPAMRAGTY